MPVFAIHIVDLGLRAVPAYPHKLGSGGRDTESQGDMSLGYPAIGGTAS
jgi:hypothetical protein